MHLNSRRFAGLALALAMLSPCAALAEPSAIYLVRHAEKAAAGKDPALTPAGNERAQMLATILHRAGITSIFSTPYLRTQQTAQPLAQRSGLGVQTYDPKAPALLVNKVKSLHGAVLVVGHSNTLPELVRLFGGGAVPDIADNEYDRLYQLVTGPDGAITAVLLTSPPATGPAR